MRRISGRWRPIAEFGERLDFIFDPDDPETITVEDSMNDAPQAFIDFRGINLENHLDKSERTALENAIKSMNTHGEESTAMAIRAFWLFIRFVPLLIIFLMLMGREFQCAGNHVIRIV
ncbi:MAG: hypothetical protein ABIG42_10630 [bacterium]